MTTLMPIIMQCPVCKKKMFDYELSSYTVYDIVLFSDGKTFPEYGASVDSMIKICVSCNQPFWVERLNSNEDDLYDLANELPKAIQISDLPFMMSENFQVEKIKYYEKLLNTGFAGNNDRKYFLRLHIWWAINDLIRHQPTVFRLLTGVENFRILIRQVKYYFSQEKLFLHFRVLFKENLTEIIRLLNPAHDDDYLLLAELYRESGRFAEAKKALRNFSDKHNKTFRRLKKRIYMFHNRVFQL